MVAMAEIPEVVAMVEIILLTKGIRSGRSESGFKLSVLRVRGLRTRPHATFFLHGGRAGGSPAMSPVLDFFSFICG